MPVSDAYTLTFDAIGTHWTISTSQRLGDELVAAIHARIEAFDRTYSRFRHDSLVQQVARQAGDYDFPNDAAALLSYYRRLYDATAGKVTPLIGGMLEKAGYDADYSFVSRQQEALPRWESVMTVDGTRLHASQPVSLDFGAAGKGYLVDIISELLESANVTNYVVNAGGDLRQRGSAAERVGLEDPTHSGQVIGVIAVQNQSLCASAVNRRQWAGFHHVFDPDTMSSTKGVIATWVVADSTMLADGIATALFFVEPAVLRKEFTFDYVRMHDDGSVDFSELFEGSLF